MASAIDDCPLSSLLLRVPKGFRENRLGTLMATLRRNLPIGVDRETQTRLDPAPWCVHDVGE